MAEKDKNEINQSYLTKYANDLIILLDDNFDFLEVNERVADLYGYAREELIGMHVTQLRTPEARDLWKEQVQIADVRGEAVYETTHQRKDGTTFPVEISLRVIKNEGRKLYHAIIRDITVRKQIEEKLRSNELQLANALKIAHLGPWEYDVVNDVFTFNDHFYAIFRTTAEREGGYTMSSADYAQRFVHPQDAFLVGQEVQETIKAGNDTVSRRLEHRIMYRDGEVGYISVLYFIVKDKNGKVIKTYGVNQDITERRKTEEALVKSEERFRMLVEQAPEAILVYDLDLGRFVDANKEAELLFGCNRQELLRLGAQDFYSPNQPDGRPPQESFEEHRKRVLNGDSLKFERVIRNAEGKELFCEVRLVKLPSLDHALIRASYLDITERKRMETALKESEARFKELFDFSTSGIVIYEVKNDGASGKDYIIKDCNNVAFQPDGLEKSQILGKTLLDIRPAIDEFGILPVFRQVWKTGVPAQYPAKMYVDGKWSSWFENRVFRLPSGEVVAVFNDITEAKKSEEELLMKNALLEGQSETTIDAILVVDKENKIVFVNSNLRKLLSLPENVVPGIDDAIPLGLVLDQVKSPEVFLKKVKYLYEHENERSRDEIELKDGRVLDRYSSPLIDSTGLYRGRIWFFRDVTDQINYQRKLQAAYKELKETQAQLVQTAKMAAMGQLVAGVSHELNQPLTGIKGYAQTAFADLKELGVPETLRQDLKKIIEQADRMASIIENLRVFARKSEVKMENIDINAPVQASLQLLGAQFRVHDIRLEVELGQGLPLINGDSNQLQQVFLNLLTNARDAVESMQRQDGEVSVQSRLSADNRHVEVLVSDNGCGISAKNKEHIFNPFFTTKDPNRGMGLGLSIAYGIIENHGGILAVESVEGQGSTFKIALPVISQK